MLNTGGFSIRRLNKTDESRRTISITTMKTENVADASGAAEVCLHRGLRSARRKSILRVVIPLVALAILAAAWYWTPLRYLMDIKKITGLAAYVRENPFAPLLVIAAYAISGLVVFPVTLLVVATAITFEPSVAFIYSLLGCLSSAVLLFYVGHLVGQDAVSRVVGPRLNRISSALGRRGLVTVITVRVFPIGPYSIVNFVAGVSHIRLRDYVIGTVLGLIPGISAITVFGAQLEDALTHPSLKNLTILLVAVVLVAIINVKVHRWMEGKPPAVSAGLPSETDKNA